MAIKKISPKTKIIGYQHNVVPQSAAGMFIGRNENKIKPLPNKILTVGPETRDIICGYGHYAGNLVEAGCALRYEYLCNVLPQQRKNVKAVK